MFVHALDGRAVSRLALNVAGQLAEMGLDSDVICTSRDESAGIDVPAGVHVHTLGDRRQPLTFRVPQLAAWLRSSRPDVLFAHLNGPGRAAILARGVAHASTRIIIVEHTHYTTFGWGRRSLRDVAIRWLYPFADRVAGVSPAVVEDFGVRFPAVRERTAVLPAVGPDPDALARVPRPDHPWYDPSDPTPVLCSVANVVPRKGQADLIEALPLVRAAIGDVRLVLVGRFDDEGFLAQLRARATALGISEHVSFVGYRADALPYIAHATVLAHASWTEGCPTVLLEAMACGTPVVATDCPGGASYVLDGGRCGVLVPVRNPAALARALVDVLRDPTLRGALVDAGRHRANDFAPRAVAQAYRALAQQCLVAATERSRAGVSGLRSGNPERLPGGPRDSGD